MATPQQKITVGIIVLYTLFSCTARAQNPMRLWYDRPAACWNEALPIGNGRLAAMIYGRTATETVGMWPMGGAPRAK